MKFMPTGTIEIDQNSLISAKEFAHEFYKNQESNDFCDDEVDVSSTPKWALQHLDALTKSLKFAGYEVSHESTGGFEFDVNFALVSTCGVESHADELYGECVCLILHNDGLIFKQGREKITAGAGDWFIFNDYKPHQVKSLKSTTALVSVVIPVKKVAQ